jgi:hypothetical protein
MKILGLTLLFSLILISVSCGSGGDLDDVSTESQSEAASEENRFDPSVGTEKEVAATTGTSEPVGDMGEQRAWFPAVLFSHISNRLRCSCSSSYFFFCAYRWIKTIFF